MKLNNILSKFCKKTGLGTLIDPSSDTHRFVFDGRFAVDVVLQQGLTDGFSLYGVAGRLEGEIDPGLMRHMLGANFLARGIDDAFVCLDTESNTLVLNCRHFEREQTLERFELAMQAFVDQIAYWSEIVLHGLPSNETVLRSRVPEQFMMRV